MQNYKRHILNLAEIFAGKGVKNIILSPGSRCAPLTLAFLRHPEIKCYSVTDERSAAFIALGMAQQLKSPVGLVCTSGTAALNYYPAITEAFYQKVPLLVLTADRPPEWTDQFDNQTIRQYEIYQKHILGSYQLPVEPKHPDALWSSDRMVSEAVNLATYPVSGPVHINIPLREPLYPDNENFTYDKNIRTFEILKQENTLSEELWITIVEMWITQPKKLILAGMNSNDKVTESLKMLNQMHDAVIISDITGNIHQVQEVTNPDIIMGTGSEELKRELAPDLLVTFGGSIVSKYAKQIIRKYKPKEHWHIQEAGLYGDTYQSLTKVIPVKPEYFFKKLAELIPQKQESNYYKLWNRQQEKAGKLLKDFFADTEFSEFQAIYEIMNRLPDDSILHLGNSMPVRYANFISTGAKNIKVFANRGTSGIDGSLSTSVGSALTTDKITTIILGDLSFFYDRNALWNNYLPANLRIIVLNNHGGGIFRILEGSGKQPELDNFFETVNKQTAENTARDFDIEYTLCNNRSKLITELDRFFTKGNKSRILEIETKSTINTGIFNKFKQKIQAPDKQ